MPLVEKVGPFVQFIGEDGLQTIVKISAIQVAAESDATGTEVMLTAANRTFRMAGSLSDLKAVLQDEWSGPRRTGDRSRDA